MPVSLCGQYILGFTGFLRDSAGAGEEAGGGQGWIRTTVRSRGQIYSLLPLTTRPPVHTSLSVTVPKSDGFQSRNWPPQRDRLAERRSLGEAARACQCRHCAFRALKTCAGAVWLAGATPQR
jgi:hypothetical protein